MGEDAGWSDSVEESDHRGSVSFTGTAVLASRLDLTLRVCINLVPCLLDGSEKLVVNGLECCLRHGLLLGERRLGCCSCCRRGRGLLHRLRRGLLLLLESRTQRRQLVYSDDK
ncbi:hypothetical protein PENTCL1PPCAC_11800, partial [Pristionchus entomophagus]